MSIISRAAADAVDVGADPQAGGKLRVCRAFAGSTAVKSSGDRGGDRFEFLGAPARDQVVLHVPQARLVLWKCLQHGAVPEKRARRIVTRRRVEDGQPLVRLAPGTGVRSDLGDRHELIGEPRDATRSQLGSFACDATERRVAFDGHGRASERSFFLADPLEPVGSLEREKQTRIACRLGRPLLAPRRRIVGWVRGHPLVEVTQRRVAWRRSMGGAQSFRREVGIAVRDQKGFAHRLDRAFDPIIGGMAPLANPAEHFVRVARTAGDALREERCDRKGRDGAVREFEPVGLGVDRKRVASADDRLDASERRAQSSPEFIGERVQLRRLIERLAGRQRPQRGLACRVRLASRCKRLPGARDFAGAFGDERTGHRPDRFSVGRKPGHPPRLHGPADVPGPTGPRRQLQCDAPGGRGIVEQRAVRTGELVVRSPCCQAPTQRDFGAGLQGARRALIAGQLGRGDGGRGAGERQHSRMHAGGCVDAFVTGREGSLGKHGQDHPVGRSERRDGRNGVRQEGLVPELDGPRSERRMRRVVAAFDQLTKQADSDSTPLPRGRGKRRRQPHGCRRQFGNACELREGRSRGGEVSLAELEPRPEHGFVGRRLCAAGLRRFAGGGRRLFDPAQAQHRGDGPRDGRELGRIGYAERGAGRLVATERARGP
jgi:hypothetical protein